MANSVIEDYVTPYSENKKPPPPSEDDDDIEAKREALAILATLGTSKELIGVDLSLGDVERLSVKDVVKYFLRYQSVLGKRVTDDLTDTIIDSGVKATSYVLPITNVDETAKDLKKNDLVN